MIHAKLQNILNVFIILSFLCPNLQSRRCRGSPCTSDVQIGVFRYKHETSVKRGCKHEALFFQKSFIIVSWCFTFSIKWRHKKDGVVKWYRCCLVWIIVEKPHRWRRRVESSTLEFRKQTHEYVGCDFFWEFWLVMFLFLNSLTIQCSDLTYTCLSRQAVTWMTDFAPINIILHSCANYIQPL